MTVSGSRPVAVCAPFGGWMWLAGMSIGLWTACAGPETGLPTNRCDTDGDCATGSCYVELGMCVTEPRTTLRIGLEVVPATDPIYGGSPRTVSFEPVEVDGSGERNLRLQPGIPVLGFAADGLADPLTADISFTTDSLIPGVAPSAVSAQARSETVRDSTGEGFLYNFSTQLLPGRIYDVTVRPTGDYAALLPPLRAQYRTPETGRHRITLRYPEPCSAAVMNDRGSSESCLATIQGLIVDGFGQPQEGMSVRVIDTVSGRTLSSTYTTGSDPEADPGWFQVTLPVEYWRDQESWVFRVTPTANRLEARGPIQTFAVAPSALYEDDGLITIRTPEVAGVVTYAGWVEAASTPAGSTPARGATLQFISQDVVDDTTGAVGSFRTSTNADQDGRFEVQLLAGSYDIIITPSQSDAVQSGLSVLREERRIDPDRPDGLRPEEPIPVLGQLFQLPCRTAFGGVVKTTTGVGMINATVRGNARGSDLGGTLPSVARYARTDTSLTDQEGRFSLDLDVGVYDIVVEPPEETNYPWRVVPDQAIGGSATPLADLYELEAPVTLTGIVSFDAGGSPIVVANGELRAYAVIEAADGTTRAVQIGRTTTDEQGHYTLLLPPSL